MPDQRSYCVQCDSEVDPCPDHPKSPRYLDDIVYEKVPTGGWKVPEAERERWENPVKAAKAVLSQPQPKPIQRLVVELEGWIFMSDKLEAQLRSAYEINPQRVSRLAERTIDGARRQSLSNPGGFLAKNVNDMLGNDKSPPPQTW